MILRWILELRRWQILTLPLLMRLPRVDQSWVKTWSASATEGRWVWRKSSGHVVGSVLEWWTLPLPAPSPSSPAATNPRTVPPQACFVGRRRWPGASPERFFFVGLLLAVLRAGQWISRETLRPSLNTNPSVSVSIRSLAALTRRAVCRPAPGCRRLVTWPIQPATLPSPLPIRPWGLHTRTVCPDLTVLTWVWTSTA